MMSERQQSRTTGANQYPTNSLGKSFTTIQAAINDLNGNGWVEIPEGTWTPFYIPGGDNYVEVRGKGRGTLIEGIGVSGHAVRVSGYGCVLRDFRVRTSGGVGWNSDTVRIEGSGVLMRNIWIEQSDAYGIYLGADATRSRIENCRAYACDLGAIYTNALITRIFGNDIWNSVYGVYLGASSDGSWVSHNDIESCTYGVACWACGVMITHNQILTAVHGVVVGSGHGGAGGAVVIDGNYIDTTTDDGVYLSGGYNTVTGNRIANWTNESVDNDSLGSTVANNTVG